MEIEDDINRYTTMCYRSPEMVDLYTEKVIGEKADVWVRSIHQSILFLFH